MSTFVLGISKGKLKSSGLDDQRFDLDEKGYANMAKAILKKNEGELLIMCSSSLDFPEEEGGEEDVDYADFVIAEIQKQSGMNEYPKSLKEDKTKMGKQSTVVHESTKGELFLSLDNGTLTLHKNGTWTWSKRE